MSTPEQKTSLKRRDIAARACETPFEITVFDTSIGSQNLGDQIIMQAAYRELRALFPQAHLWSVPTHDTFGQAGRKRQRHSLFAIACGTNLIHAKMPGKGHWKLPFWPRLGMPPIGRYRPPNLCLMAVGSNAEALSPGAASYLSGTLWNRVPASVRDKATAGIFADAGLGASHTGCVTMWALPEDHAERLPKEKAEAAVVCLTGTRRASRAAIERDMRMLDAVSSAYSRRFLWPQGQVDLEYYLSLGRSDFEILEHSLQAYEALLASDLSLDFVGARLHAGILAMMHGRRPLIVKVDNRAADIGSSVNLPVIGAEDFPRLDAMIAEPRETRIDLPRAEIDSWREAIRTAVDEALPETLDLRAFRGR